MGTKKRLAFIPLRKFTQEEIDKFYRKVIKGETENDCWGWNGKPGANEYGVFKIKFERYRATRVSYFLHYGVDPELLFVCHKCDNPICTNPAHLFLGTQKDNMQDAAKKKRLPIGEKNCRSRLNESSIKEIIELYSKGNISELQLSKRFSVGQATIHRALIGESWKHIDIPGKGKVTKSRKERGLINHHSRTIIQCDLNGKEIARYTSIVDASQATGCNASSLAIKSRNGEMFKNFIWKTEK